jgi:hypothetical protein
LPSRPVWERGDVGSRDLRLGGITGYDAVETTDENPERVATTQRLTLVYLRSTLYSGDPAWSEAGAAFSELTKLGHIESK